MTRAMFLCTGNTCRSQMAEGFARELGKGVIEAYSAGLAPAGVLHPKAIAVMKEDAIDISIQKSKAIDPDLLGKMDIVVTLCGNAEASCPTTPPSIRRIHWPIDDPVAAVGTEDEVMKKFRKARDEIKEKILELINALGSGG
jgi:arsenate reductase